MNNYIPTLEGDEAEEFIRKAESAERTTVWLNGHFNADLSVVVGI